MEEAFHRKKVLMTHVGLELYLEDELVLHVVAFDDRFRDFFQGVKRFCPFVQGLVDIAELAFSQ
jgi:hypothetical protein